MEHSRVPSPSRVPPADVPYPPLHPSLASPGSCHRGFTALSSWSSFHKQLKKNIHHNPSARHCWCPGPHPLSTYLHSQKVVAWKNPVLLCLGAGNSRKADVLIPLEAVLSQDGWGWVSGYPVCLGPGWIALGVCSTLSPRMPPADSVSSFSQAHLPDDYHCLYQLSFLLCVIPTSILVFPRISSQTICSQILAWRFASEKALP